MTDYPSPTYWAVVHDSNELLGIMKSPEDPDLRYDEEQILVSEELGHEEWYWQELTLAEFETYQAFDIIEFKL